MLSENKKKTLQVRLTEEDYTYVAIVATMAGMTVSQYTRSLLQATINAAKLAEQEGKIDVENFKAILDDKL